MALLEACADRVPPRHHLSSHPITRPAEDHDLRAGVLAGYCPLGNYPGRGQPDQQFAGHAVAGSELGGAILAHVAAADPGSRRAHLLEAVAELRGALDDDEGLRRGGVVDRRRDLGIPPQATALDRLRVGGEQELKVPGPPVQHEPDRFDVGASV